MAKYLDAQGLRTLWGKIKERDTAISGKIDTINNNIGKENGIASLDANGKIPTNMLPSYVDDVIEGYYKNVTGVDNGFYEDETCNKPLPDSKLSGKIYVDKKTNKTYRWSGTAYVEISSSIVIGTTAGTAFDGAKGNEIYNQVKNGGLISSANYIQVSNLNGKYEVSINDNKVERDIDYTGPNAENLTTVSYVQEAIVSRVKEKLQISGGDEYIKVSTGVGANIIKEISLDPNKVEVSWDYQSETNLMTMGATKDLLETNVQALSPTELNAILV